jgi:NhaA family Na+:H+ antiporter
MHIPRLLSDFLNSEKAGGILLVACTAISMILANSPLQELYAGIWNHPMAGHNVGHWINDGLMAVFFLLIGLELEREIYTGELSTLKNASLPVVAAMGGILLPAGFYMLFNYGTVTQSGAGIPMATDIAFALGILSLLGNRIPISLKIFLTALAVIDDLGAIVIIAVLYTAQISYLSLLIALTIFLFLVLLNRLKVYSLIPYLIGGIMMWYFMLHSGVHATITGVLLAFAIPHHRVGQDSPSHVLEHFLHKPVAFIILPLFALANTAITLDAGFFEQLAMPNSLGIAAGLLFGKPLGIVSFSLLAVSIGICSLPEELNWKHIIGVGFLGGIGFTMSVFITLLAFSDPLHIASSKIAVLLASALSAITGLIWLAAISRKRR